MEKSFMTFNTLHERLSQLQIERKAPLIFYGSRIDGQTTRILYKLLRQQGPVKRLDLVLCTGGGSVNVARRLALLLHEYTEHLTILVPYKAHSAGTLLCLAAHELILTPIAELSPLDPQIDAEGSVGPAAPSRISAEEVRLFRQMAQEWFGVESEAYHAHLLSVIAQRIFPTSLSAFYRAELLMQQSASEMLSYHLLKYSKQARELIVDQLIHGYASHDYTITYKEVQRLGLSASLPSPREAALLEDIQDEFQQITEDRPDRKEFVHGVIADIHVLAREVSHKTATSVETARGAGIVHSMTEPRWTIEDWRN